MPKITVIIPVYNAKNYLCRCVESVLGQSFNDFELILVDDGSSDKSGAICDYYVSKDERVKVIHQLNQGVSVARNNGIDIANSKWIAFIDSDDYVGNKYLSVLINSQQENSSDFVMSGHKKIKDNRIIAKREYDSLFLRSKDYGRLFDLKILQLQKAPWAKLYNLNIINKHNIRFCEKIRHGEDAIFVYTYLLHSKSISIAPGSEYFYDLHSGSLTTKGFSSYDDEIRGFHIFKPIMEQLLSSIKTDSKYPMEYLTYWQERVRESIYHDDYLNRRERIKRLESLDMDLFKKYSNNHSWKESLINYLLTNRYFNFYDFVRQCLKK